MLQLVISFILKSKTINNPMLEEAHQASGAECVIHQGPGAAREGSDHNPITRGTLNRFDSTAKLSFVQFWSHKTLC